jgi:hypothetical protein
MKVATSELEGAALDWAVAKCEGRRVGVMTVKEQRERFLRGVPDDKIDDCDRLICSGFKAKLCGVHEDGYKSTVDARKWRYSESWEIAGPIIEREELHVLPTGDAAKWKAYRWIDHGNEAGNFSRESYGPTALVAAMRCFVYSKLGDTVDVPDELMEK